MRILVLTQHYRPEPNFITADLAESLAAGGHKVTVVTAHPNYPLGRFYETVKSRWPRKALEGGVVVWRLPFFPDHSQSKIWRFIAYFSFAAMAALFAPWFCPRPKLVVVYQAPFTVALAALFYKVLCRRRVLYVSTDLWPESFTASGVAPRSSILKVMYAYSRWINGFADHIITSTAGMRMRYLGDGVAADKVTFLPVWVDGVPADYQKTWQAAQAAMAVQAPKVGAASVPLDRPFRIVYTGNLGPAQDLGTVLKAAAILERAGERVVFDFYGTGSSEAELRQIARELGLQAVTFHGRVSADRAFAACQAADGVIVHLRNSAMFRLTLPSKLANYFASGSYIFCGAEGETADVVGQSGAGAVFDPGDAEGLAACVRRAMRLSPVERSVVRQSAWTYYEEMFAKARLLQRYCSIAEELLLGKTGCEKRLRTPESA